MTIRKQMWNDDTDSRMTEITTATGRNWSKAQATKKMWSEEIRQVVEVFQETVHIHQVIKDPVDYVGKHKTYLRSAGPVLEFLELAKSDRKSPFGWKPTPLLMTFIAERKTKKKSKPLYEAPILEGLIADYVFGYRQNSGKYCLFAYELLNGLGLRYYDGDVYWATEDLHNLFHNGYYDKRERDGLPPW